MNISAACDVTTFWQNLAQEFESLRHPLKVLIAAWITIGGRDHPGIWIPRPESEETRGAWVRLTHLATMAVKALGRDPSVLTDLGEPSTLEAPFEAKLGNTDLSLVLGIRDPWLRSWLELLREASSEFKISGSGLTKVSDKGGNSRRGMFTDVCKASRNYCLEPSTQATIVDGATDNKKDNLAEADKSRIFGSCTLGGQLADPVQESSRCIENEEEAHDAARGWQKQIADMNARCERRLGRNLFQSTRQEELLLDATEYVAMSLKKAVRDLDLPRNPSESEIDAACVELRDHLLLEALKEHIPKHKYYEDLKLGTRDLQSALWTEGFPSLEVRARAAILRRALSRSKKTPANTTADSGTRSAAENVASSFATAKRRFEVHSWRDLKIQFLSDKRIQVTEGPRTESFNFGDLGFEDRRSGTPNQAWGALRCLAEASGTLPRRQNGSDGVRMEKRMQELRKTLRSCFKPEDDPFTWIKGVGYTALFQISLAPAYNA